MSLEKARTHLELAVKQLEKAQCDSWEPEDASSCVTNTFYAYENLIVAVAEAHNMRWSKNHYKKADLAEALANKKIVKTNLKEEILRLNDLRKDVSYGEEGEDLSAEDLEKLVVELEEFVEEVEAIVVDLEEANEEN
jgi:hypothetical protein